MTAGMSAAIVILALPAATAALAKMGTNSRWPPDMFPRPPGSCTEWVASKQTGKPIFCMMGMARKSLTRLL